MCLRSLCAYGVCVWRVCVWRVCVWHVELVPAYLAAGLKKDAMEAIPFVVRPALVDSDIIINSATPTDIRLVLLTYGASTVPTITILIFREHKQTQYSHSHAALLSRKLSPQPHKAPDLTRLLRALTHAL